MMPASRAACSGSPFFTLPARTSLSALADIEIDPRATASRSVMGLSPTSTMRIRPFESTWVSRLIFIVHSLRKIEGQALEGDSQIDAFHLDAGGHFERTRREIQHRLDARIHGLV